MKTILLLLTLFVIKSEAQKRIYFDQGTTSPVSPTFNATWTITTGAVYRMMMSSKTQFSRSGAATLTSGQSGAVAPRKMLCASFETQPLQAQTLNSGGTISFQIRCNKNASAPTCNLAIYARVCNEDGTNIREIGNASSTNMVNGTAANRTVTITIGSNVTINERDRIIFELGGDFTSGTVTTLTASILPNINPTTADLPVDNTTTTASVSWCEFSQNILFVKSGVPL